MGTWCQCYETFSSFIAFAKKLERSSTMQRLGNFNFCEPARVEHLTLPHSMDMFLALLHC
jgi:hypothetical protein